MELNDLDTANIVTMAVGAIVILLVTWLVARLVKWVFTKHTGRLPLLQKEAASGETLGQSLGTIGSLVVWLVGLTAVLNLFGLTSVVAPIQELLNGVLGVVPDLIGAGLILFIGIVLARIARQLVEAAIRTSGLDRRLDGTSTDAPAGGAAGGAATATGTTSGQTVSDLVGQLVFALIVIVVAISAFQVLGIEAISEPATQMLTLVLDAIPLVLAAALLLAVGHVIGRFVAPLLESTLRGLGTDRALADIGVGGTGSTAPSALAGRLAHVAIVIFFAVAATRLLGFAEVTEILNTVLEIAGQVVFGAAIIGAGVLVANLLARLVSGSAGTVVRYATIGLFVAMGLQFMGLADIIVTLAFGSVVVGAALAAAIAFGLGGRDAAARELGRWQDRPSQPATGDPLG